MRLSNFASLDPSLRERGIRGLSSYSKQVAQIWDKFSQDPEDIAFQGEVLLANKLGKPVEILSGINSNDINVQGVEREALVKTRVNQSLFRKRVLSIYEYRCCITGIDVPELLVASHIVPWSMDIPNRLNPRNGLCLNALHDRAFDRGLIWIDEKFVLRTSPRLIASRTTSKYKYAALLLDCDGQSLSFPKDIVPDENLLRWHRQYVAAVL